MPFAIHRSPKTAPRLVFIALLVLFLTALNGCDGDNFYSGTPLSNAAVSFTAIRLPDSASTARISYTVRWWILDDDFRRYPYLVEIKNTSTGQFFDIHSTSPADSATATFVCTSKPCEPGQFWATVFAELEKGKLLRVGYTDATVPK